MAQVQIEIEDSGIQEILHFVGENICAQYASEAAAACGDGYEFDTYNAGNRTVASVAAVTWDAYKDNLANNTILRSLGNGDA